MDPNSQYPVRQPQRRVQNPFANNNNPSKSQQPLRLNQQSMLPAAGMRKMLGISLVAGIIAAIVNIVVTLVNAPLYQQAASYSNHPTQMPLNVASAIFGLFVLTGVIGLIIYFIAGYIIGRVTVVRRLGFFGGFLASVIALVIGYIVEQIPNYPGSINTGFSGNPLKSGVGLITALIILVLVSLIGGLLGWLGARLATRRHPLYAGPDA